MAHPTRSLPALLAAGLLAFVGLGCPGSGPTTRLQITQVSFTQTVVLPGETVEISVIVEGADDPTYAWTADAGDFSAAASATTAWTAPANEQLVAMTITVTASGDRRVRHTTDVVVGYGQDHDGDGYSLRQGDCDDTASSVHPGAADIQDGLDNDCDGQIDEGDPLSDDDGDGYSDLAGDCDDGDPSVHPGAPEVANGIDDDCDSVVDEGTDVFDDDGDGFCEQGPCRGTAQTGDCNDASSAVSPASVEILDGVDNDCDNTIDEGTAGHDDDGDGFSELQGDCDDSSTEAAPGLAESIDGADNDCDGLIDEDFLVDLDGDGWTVLAGDCDDEDFYTYPSAAEFADGADNDCDGSVDNAMDGSDDDGDGFSEAQGDCDDTQSAVFPEAPEVDDSPLDLDNDCDGYVFSNPPHAIASTLSSITDTCTSVDLDGGGSWDPDDDTLTYYWFFARQPINSDLDSDDILDGDSASASFTPDVAGAWTVGLLVGDGTFNSAPSTLSFTVSTGSCP